MDSELVIIFLLQFLLLGAGRHSKSIQVDGKFYSKSDLELGTVESDYGHDLRTISQKMNMLEGKMDQMSQDLQLCLTKQEQVQGDIATYIPQQEEIYVNITQALQNVLHFLNKSPSKSDNQEHLLSELKSVVDKMDNLTGSLNSVMKYLQQSENPNEKILEHRAKNLEGKFDSDWSSMGVQVQDGNNLESQCAQLESSLTNIARNQLKDAIQINDNGEDTISKLRDREVQLLNARHWSNNIASELNKINVSASLKNTAYNLSSLLAILENSAPSLFTSIEDMQSGLAVILDEMLNAVPQKKATACLTNVKNSLMTKLDFQDFEKSLFQKINSIECNNSPSKERRSHVSRVDKKMMAEIVEKLKILNDEISEQRKYIINKVSTLQAGLKRISHAVSKPT